MHRGTEIERKLLRPVMHLQRIPSKKVYSAYSVIISLGLALLIVFLAKSCHAEISQEIGVHCILGEARGEGYTSLLAHAEALRNRNNTQGVYGCQADLSKEMPYLKRTGIYNDAIKAWQKSKHSKITHGASFWGSLIVDKKWIAKMDRNGFKQTVIIGNTAFYKKIKKG